MWNCFIQAYTFSTHAQPFPRYVTGCPVVQQGAQYHHIMDPTFKVLASR